MNGYRLDLASLMGDVSINQKNLDAGNSLTYTDDSASAAKVHKPNRSLKDTGVSAIEVPDTDLCNKLRYLTTFEVHPLPSNVISFNFFSSHL